MWYVSTNECSVEKENVKVEILCKKRHRRRKMVAFRRFGERPQIWSYIYYIVLSFVLWMYQSRVFRDTTFEPSGPQKIPSGGELQSRHPVGVVRDKHDLFDCMYVCITELSLILFFSSTINVFGCLREGSCGREWTKRRPMWLCMSHCRSRSTPLTHRFRICVIVYICESTSVVKNKIKYIIFNYVYYILVSSYTVYIVYTDSTEQL